MGELSRWRDEIVAAGYSTFRANQEVEALMTARYAVCAERNSLNNDQKSGYIHNAGEWLTGCLVLVILRRVSLFYQQDRAGCSASRDSGHIAGPESRLKENVMANPGGGNPPPPPPPLPPPPPIRLVKEDSVPGLRKD
jgi:hypothetical protein